MKTIPHRHHAAGKRKVRQRLDRPITAPSPEPVFAASNIHYEAATKTRAIACGGIGAIPGALLSAHRDGGDERELGRLDAEGPEGVVIHAGDDAREAAGPEAQAVGGDDPGGGGGGVRGHWRTMYMHSLCRRKTSSAMRTAN